MTVFITGSGGFVGSHLAEHLDNRGEDVICFVHSESDRCWLDTSSFKCIYGDIRDQELLMNAVEGSNQIYHLAALLPSPSYTLEEYTAVNVEGTRNVMNAALKNDVDKVVYTSSRLSVDESGSQEVDESFRHRTFFNNPYSLTKYKGEKILFEYGARGIDVTAVNPALIYGPRETEQIAPLVRMYLSLPVGVSGFEDSIFNFVYIDDVVEGHASAMESGESGHRYLLTGEQMSIGDFLNLVDELTETNKPRVSIPNWVVNLSVRVGSPVIKAMGIDPPLSRESLQSMKVPVLLDGSKGQSELNLNPTSLNEGLKRTLAWYRSEGII